MSTAKSKLSSHPGGPENPYDLHTIADAFDKLQTWIAQYGDVISIPPLKRKDPCFFINNADMLKHILVSNHKNYVKGAAFDRVKLLLGNGIIVSDGTFWRKQRRMIQPAFGKEVIAEIFQNMKGCNFAILDDWQKRAAEDGTINITDLTNELALEIILRAIFSIDFDEITRGDDGNPFSILTDNSTRDLQLAVKFRELKQLLQKFIDKRRQATDRPNDFLTAFIEARDKDSGEAMTDKELLDELVTLIVAGSETSAATMNWVWYLLSQHPEVEAKVHAEIDAASFDDAPDFMQCIELSYLKQVIEEALRLYPPVWLYSRKAIDDDTVGSFEIPAGTDIFISPYFLHRNKDYWDDADAFNPERFSDENIKKRHKFAFIPFSAGPRRCIGDFFGTVEAQIHFAILARHFKLRLQNTEALELEPEVNLRTKNPFIMKIERR
ncbi:MAG: cytochrome P450 [Gammaproteobacteria bacterium]|nr:cytochrome P450 [Gammaproteobacteria bacterium]MDH5778367.1 cytochrome P450 [Gammaproteobacteria bacterium]